MSLFGRPRSRASSGARRSRAYAIAACVAMLAQALPMGTGVALATVIEPGFQVATIVSGLDTPTAIGFAP